MIQAKAVILLFATLLATTLALRIAHHSVHLQGTVAPQAIQPV